MASGNDPEGIEVHPVSAWFSDNIPGAVLPLTFSLLAGGRSNLTYRVEDAGGQTWALRRPPISHVLATAHDMGREHRLLSALAPTSVPVPTPVAYCDDVSVNGSGFYVMEFVDGLILRSTSEALELDEGARRRAGFGLIDVLTDLHAVDVDAVGLGTLARRENYIERQLKRWYGQFAQSVGQVRQAPVPAVDEVHLGLSQRIPRQGPAAIVHGDFRLDNAVVGPDGSIRAVLDWELCTLGDPLADLGLLMVYWAEPGERGALVQAPTSIPGFPRRRELVERYVARAERPVDDLGYYVAFGYWKLACVLEGVYARYSAGARGGDRSDATVLADQVVWLAEQAREHLSGSARV